MEDEIEQHRLMLLENKEKYMFLYSPSIENIVKEHFVTFDAEEAINFCIENKCKLEIFYLDILRSDYVSFNAFITPPQ